MLINYITIALRNLLKDKGYTTLNMLGLTVGITFSLLLLLYVTDELRFDRFHTHSDRMVRIGAHINETENEFHWSSSQLLTAETLKKTTPPRWKRLCACWATANWNSETATSAFWKPAFTCPVEITKIFTLPFVEGEPSTALAEPNSIVVAKSVAEKYFGTNTSFLGKTLTNARNETWKITGVMEDMPAHSHIRIEGLLSYYEIRRQIGKRRQLGGNSMPLRRPC